MTDKDYDTAEINRLNVALACAYGERDAALAEVRDLEIENQKRVQDKNDITLWLEECKNERDAALARVSALERLLECSNHDIAVRRDHIFKIEQQNVALRSLVRDCITLIANVFSPDVSDEELANWIDASVIIFDRAKQMQIIGAEQEQKGAQNV